MRIEEQNCTLQHEKPLKLCSLSSFFLLALSQQTEEHVFLILSSVTAMAENI